MRQFCLPPVWQIHRLSSKLTISLAMMIWDGVSPSGSNMKCVCWLTEMPAVFVVGVLAAVAVGVKK
jgi:hypothetical protein